MGETLVIARRYLGPPESGNGGYSCGVLAGLIDGPAEVTLRLPPPLETPLDVERTDGGVRLLTGGRVVAEGRPIAMELDAPPAPSFAEATAATERYPWRDKHPYPGCFVCGPARTAGDGLCIFPGAVAGRELAAAPFIPDETLAGADGLARSEIVWASLDCPSWFGFDAFHPFTEGLMLLGRLAGRVERRPRVGERCIAAGWFVRREGRKIRCGSALYAEDGEVLAVGRATWIALK